MSNELSDEEREYMRGFRIASALGFGQTDPRGLWANRPTRVEVDQSAAELVARVRETYPLRTERLVVLSAIANAAKAERDQLLADVIAAEFHWTRNVHSGEFCSIAWQQYDREALASLTGLTPQTIQRWIQRAVKQTLAEVEAELAEARAEIEAELDQ